MSVPRGLSGVHSQVLAKNGQPVRFGDDVFIIDAVYEGNNVTLSGRTTSRFDAMELYPDYDWDGDDED